jgi:5-(carboxyamino)imidazole ribonucleotide mutase
LRLARLTRESKAGLGQVFRLSYPRRSTITARFLKPRGPAAAGTSNMSVAAAPVAIIMGSQSDWDCMRHAAETLAKLGVEHDVRIVSAHRTPDRLYAFAKGAKASGVRVVIAGAGGAAHLPGMTAALTPLPVLGVPVESRSLKGVDSLHSIVQMPGGIPVGTLAIGKPGAINAALLAAAILALSDDALAARLDAYRAAQTAAVAERPENETP